jgi:hypothetical protein
VWFAEPVPPEEVVFDHDVYLLHKERARTLRAEPVVISPPGAPARPDIVTQPPKPVPPGPVEPPGRVTIRISGSVPPEIWNRLGTKLLPKLRTLKDLETSVEFTCEVEAAHQAAVVAELRTVVEELGLSHSLRIQQVPLAETRGAASGE